MGLDQYLTHMPIIPYIFLATPKVDLDDVMFYVYTCLFGVRMLPDMVRLCGSV